MLEAVVREGFDEGSPSPPKGPLDGPEFVFPRVNGPAPAPAAGALADASPNVTVDAPLELPKAEFALTLLPPLRVAKDAELVRLFVEGADEKPPNVEEATAAALLPKPEEDPNPAADPPKEMPVPPVPLLAAGEPNVLEPSAPPDDPKVNEAVPEALPAPAVLPNERPAPGAGLRAEF